MEAHAMRMEGYRDDVKQNKQSERRKPRISIGRLALKDWPARVPVSYTHLDVYKRQVSRAKIAKIRG